MKELQSLQHSKRFVPFHAMKTGLSMTSKISNLSLQTSYFVLSSKSLSGFSLQPSALILHPSFMPLTCPLASQKYGLSYAYDSEDACHFLNDFNSP